VYTSGQARVPVLLPMQVDSQPIELEHWIYCLGKFNFGPAHASSNHVLPTFVNKNR